MRVGELCTRDVVVIETDASLVDAASLMRTFHVGDVVVVEHRGDKRVPVGILTDRDMVIELIAQRVDYNEVSIEDVMTYQLVTSTEDEDVMDAVERMKSNGVRRLPVIDRSGGLVGILAMDDLIDFIAEQVSDLASLISRASTCEQRKHH
jgi:CBS domain-containing protein